MTGRDDSGRFVVGNAWAAMGGRRRAIAAAGYAAMCAKYYGGDAHAAARALAQAANPEDALFFGHTFRG